VKKNSNVSPAQQWEPSFLSSQYVVPVLKEGMKCLIVKPFYDAIMRKGNLLNCSFTIISLSKLKLALRTTVEIDSIHTVSFHLFVIIL